MESLPKKVKESNQTNEKEGGREDKRKTRATTEHTKQIKSKDLGEVDQTLPSSQFPINQN